MSEEKRKGGKLKKNRRESSAYEYINTVAVFTVIAFAAVIITAFAAIGPVAELVHKVEKSLCMQVRDIEITQNTGKDIVYGSKTAVLTCEDTGINCDVYFGANRASMRCGAGIDYRFSKFGSSAKAVVSGYDTTYFSSLDYTENGDVFTVNADGKTYRYKVYKTELTEKSYESYDNLDNGTLVLYSVFSDFSENKGQRFYVFAKLIDSGEAA